jgi:cytochrome c oxidase assembly protein Cox11
MSEQIRTSGRNRNTALVCGAVVAGMVALSFAAVPLYRVFCQVTGFGGTTQRAEAVAGPVLDRMMTVRFDSNVGAGLPWEFKPVERADRSEGRRAGARPAIAPPTARTVPPPAPPPST